MSISVEEKGLHIASRPDLYEPSKSNAFDLLIPDIANLLPQGVYAELSTDEDILHGVQDVIRLAVDSASVPHFTLGKIEVKRANSTVKFASGPTWESGTLKCTDFVGARVKDFLLALQGQAYDVRRDVVKLATSYKHDWTLIEYTGDYSRVIRKWTLKGAWISGLSEEEFSHDSEGKRTISVTVEYDRAIPEIVQESVAE